MLTLENLEQQVNRLSQRLALSERNNFQLSFPLDEISQRVVKELLPFPVAITLPGTLAGSANAYSIFFTNNDNSTWEVHSISESHTVAGTDGGAVTLQLERLQGTEALDSGDNLLATAFNLKTAANTVQYATTVVNKALLTIEKGDRLALKDSGTLTSIQGVNLTVYLIKVN